MSPTPNRATLHPAPELQDRSMVLHGRQVHYRHGGHGPLVLLLHGLACDSSTWDELLPALVTDHEVIALDIPGHGRSDKPRCDYSPAALANVVRDLLDQLGHRRLTVVGHSFGGGLANQLAYQFPGLVERLVLIAGGGLGTEVSLFLRALSLPGAPEALTFFSRLAGLVPGTASLPQLADSTMRAQPHWLVHLLAQALRTSAAFRAPDAREAFARTLRTAIDVRGQRIDGKSRVHTFSHLPALLIWGQEDNVIPFRHGQDTVRDVWPRAEFALVPEAGHFVHRDHPEHVATLIRDFLSRSAPSVDDTVTPADVLLAPLPSVVGRNGSGHPLAA